MITGWRFWNVFLSAAFFGWAVFELLTSSSKNAASLLIPLLPVLGFIWFCDFWSGWLGPLFGGGHYAKSVDSPSPAWLIAVFGWLIMITVVSLIFSETGR